MEDLNSRLVKACIGTNFPWKGNYKLKLSQSEPEDFGDGLKRMIVEVIDDFCTQHEKFVVQSILQRTRTCMSELGEGASVVQVRRLRKPCKIKKEVAKRQLISFYPRDQEAIEAIKRFQYIADLRIPVFGPSKICQVGLLVLQDMIEQDPKGLERLLLQSQRA